jgi:hypothetical protein
MAVIVKIRRGTTTQWESSTKVLQVGELGIDTTLNKIKAGNGSSLWSTLPWLVVSPDELTTQASSTLQDANDYTDTAVSGLGNSLDGQYVLVADVGNLDGVAPLDENGLISDLYIPDGIARDSEIITSYNDLADLPTLFSGSYNDLTDAPTIPSLTGYATETYVGTAISNLVDTAPETLNTLNELAAALGDDQNFATTVSTNLGLKAPINDPVFTGTVGGITKSMVGLENVDNTTDANKPVSTATQTALDLKLNLTEPSVDYYITNSGSGAYLVNGVSNGLITFEKGKKYRIHINAPGHPFWIQTVSGGYSEVNVYTQGVTGAGAQDGSIIVELPQNAPNNLYYACQFHSSMAGSIYVQEANHLASKDYVNTVFYNTVVEGMEHTVSVNDIANMTEFTSNSSIIVTIPDDPTDSDFPIGSVIEYRQMGSGRIEFVPTSPAVLVSTDGYRKTRTQYSGIMLEKRASNSWILVGDIDA